MDPIGNVYVTGWTGSADFPTTSGTYDETYNGGYDLYVSKISPDGSALVYSTYVGGGGYDGADGGIVLGPTGYAYVAGETASSTFPTTPSAYDKSFNGRYDTFVTALSSDGESILYSTYIGGTDDDIGYGIALDSAGHVYVTGRTASATFPATAGSYDGNQSGDVDAFVVKVHPNGAPPVADAGPDLAMPFNTTVTLSGLNSSDSDGDVLKYSWTQIGGPPVVLNNASSAVSWFDAQTLGTHSFGLEVTDPWNTSGADTITISVLNTPPAASAGPDQAAVRGQTVRLNGTGSDSNGDVITFTWTQVSGPETLNLTSVSPQSIAFVPNMVGTYLFNLTVRDTLDASSYDWTGVTVTNRVPAVDAGPDQSVLKKALVTLAGSGSDPDHDTLILSWVQTAGPLVMMTGNDTATPSFTPTEAGSYVFHLSIDDGFGGTSTDIVTVTVINRAPTADAGGPYACSAGGSVTLNGAGSTDPDGDGLTYEWTVPFTPPVTLSGPSPTLTCPTTAGTLNITLAVTDSGGPSDTDDATLSVQPGGGLEDWAWFLLVLAAVIALVLVLLVLLRRKKRKGETADPHPAGTTAPPKGP